MKIVRRVLDAWNRRDLEAVEAFAADGEVDWSASRGPQRGVYRGRAEARQFWESWWELFEATNFEAEDFVAADDRVIVPNRTYFRGRDGIEVAASSALEFTLREGKIVRIRLHQDASEAFRAAGLSE